MNLAIIARRVGPMFREGTDRTVNTLLDAGILKSQAALIRGIRANAPQRTGQLRSSIAGRGEALKRTVYSSLRRTIPLEFGWLPASQRQALRSIRAIGGRGSRKRARAILSGKVAGRKFFYSTFDAMIPQLQAQYLAPVGAAIVRELS